MADWVVLSGVLNRVNNSMGRDDLYPFPISTRTSSRSLASSIAS